MSESIPKWLLPTAKLVHGLITRPGGMARFRERLLAWGQERSFQEQQFREWDDRWCEYKRKILDEQEAAGFCLALLPTSDPPKPGWVFEEFGVRVGVGQRKMVHGAGWHPPDACWANRPKEYEAPLPLNDEFGEPLPPDEDRTLSIAESYTVVAAIHDATYKRIELINPWECLDRPKDEPAASRFDSCVSEYSRMISEARRIPEDDKASVEAFFHAVETDLGIPAPVVEAKNEPDSRVKDKSASDGNLMTNGERRVWEALESRALSANELVKELNQKKNYITSIETIRQHIKTLRRKSRDIPHTRGRGYWRTDAPPLDIRHTA